jgi:purine-binding chemotaxis protein CheW
MADLFLVIRIAGERVAVRSSSVESVIEVEAVTSIPGVADHVAGLTALRSRVLTAIDCHAALEPGRRLAKVRDALVVSVEGHAYALLVEGADDVVEGSFEATAPPAGLQGGWARAAAGCVETAYGLLLLVDPAALVAGPGARPGPRLNPLLTNCA